MSKLGKSVTAVVVTYQSARTIEKSLSALRRCHQDDLLDVIVVDNGSTDKTAEILRNHGDWAKVILTGKNNGFGRGCNIGFEYVVSPITIFVNPDAVVEPDAIRALLDFLVDNPKVGIVGPAIVEGEDAGEKTLQIAGDRMTPVDICRAITPLFNRRSTSYQIIPGAAAFRVGWVCGAVFMIRTALMKELKGFDPRFFLYWEETDVCKRADDLGYETWAVGAAVTKHIGGASSSPDDTRIGGCIAKHYYQSRFYYLQKHHGFLAPAAAEVYEFILLMLRTVMDGIRGRGLKRLRPRLQTALFSTPDRP